MITVSTRKNGEYYHAVLMVTDGDYRKTYVSKDVFVTRKTAKKQAEWWRHESIRGANYRLLKLPVIECPQQSRRRRR